MGSGSDRRQARRCDGLAVALVMFVGYVKRDAAGQLWISLGVPFTYVYDIEGDKTRTVQFQAAGVLNPTSLFFTQQGRLLVTPGCYEFAPSR